ncbi:MAG: hypothetical protein ACPID2_02605 [Candidatus Puniceispirillum sp.]
MHLSRLFCLPSVPLSVASLIVIAGLMTACQPQNIATNGTPAITNAAQQTDPIAADENTANPDAGETVSEAITETAIAALPDADNKPEDNADSTTTVASIPPQPSDDQSADSESETTAVSPEKRAPEIVKPAPPSPPPAFKPDTVLSKADSVLLSQLGVADIIRTEGQVRIWQYRLDRCVFDFFLTPANSQSPDGTYMVRDWAYRATTLGVTANELICRRALAKDRMRPASG